MRTDVDTTPDGETADPHPRGGTALALKEWGAAVHGLLQGRQTILLRKGGIHEKAFLAPQAGGGFVLFPTVAHTHAERTRPEHHDLLPLGDADADESSVTIRAGVQVVDVVEVTRPDGLPEIAAEHIWTDESIQVDRVEFRPRHPLQVLVVRALALETPRTLPRLDAYGGCRSWLDVDMDWDGSGDPVVGEDRLRAVAAMVRDAVA